MAYSQGQEDYIKIIYELNGHNDYVSNKQIAETLEISPPSVSDMIKKMEKEAIVDFIAYKGVKLTPKGLKVAIDVIRRHRMIEVFLYEKLGYQLNELDGDAEQMEHITSDIFYQRLEKFLGNPQYCPHGSLIPSYEQFEETHALSLLETNPDNQVTIKRVMDKKDLLDYLKRIKLVIGDKITIIDKDSINQIIIFRHQGENHYLSYLLADMIFVEINNE